MKMRIFIVEDDEILRKYYEKALNFNGCEVITSAINGKDAVQKFSQLTQKPDIIFMDYKMPVMNGIEAMKEILEIDKTAKIFFISADDSVKELAISLGAIGFECKPISLEKFIQIIKNIELK